MYEKLNELSDEYRTELCHLFNNYFEKAKEDPFLLQSDIKTIYDEYSQKQDNSVFEDTILEDFIIDTRVMVIKYPWLYFAVRKDIGKWEYIKFDQENVNFQKIEVKEYLQFQETLINGKSDEENWPLEINVAPFYKDFPKLREKTSIGNGVSFLNKHLSSRLFSDIEEEAENLFNFLHEHEYNGKKLMVNELIQSPDELRQALRDAISYLEDKSENKSWNDVRIELKKKGFERGWGREVDTIQNRMQRLINIMEAPSPESLEKFLGDLPMVFNIVIVSPHGYFAQSDVLGKPDTGGQIVYILDQVRALEKDLKKRIYDQGLDVDPQILILTRQIPNSGETTCDQRLEDVHGTEHAKILRVPFRNKEGDVVPDWISRFRLWPYVERYAIESEKEILAELQDKPDLIIGNYSDGNLVAMLLAQSMGVTLGTIAHALEKTKYLFSDLYWKESENEYHFSTQFTADLLAMNAADFVITNTYYEIAGNQDSAGLYESHTSFTMPDLYRVVKGIDIYDPKFNVISPGSNPDIFFPYTEKDRRLTEFHDRIDHMIFGEEDDTHKGLLKNQDKPLLFLMSRLDKIKNVTGFIRGYGESDKLRELTNVFVIGGYLDINKSNDDEEREEIEKMHHYFDKYDLYDQVRWTNLQPDKNLVGEIYRYIADRRGAFIQPGFYETFGLTVVESMVSGLPTFATLYGGPREIIEDGKSGFHLDPNKNEDMIEIVTDFFKKVDKNPEYWKEISKGGIKRVNEKYTWKKYADRLITNSSIYSFWKYVTNLERQGLQTYLKTLYNLLFRPLAQNKFQHQ
ncbi:MAG: sucrose synthase [Candidatus Marinimicrobia bacterium]|nr:sucrose synthase [Candidatus Neomarinimicrobiota bacterium]